MQRANQMRSSICAVAYVVLFAAIAAHAAPARGKTFRDCATCPEMVVIPAGTFVMGSPESEALRDPDETQHTVTFRHAFAISKYPITWDEWEACARDSVCAGRDVDVSLRTGLDGKPIQNYVDHGRGNRPVVGVSWYDALVFAGWLNKKSGKDDYRLVSEAEFEYAARAGTTTAYPWGETPDHNFANFGKIDGTSLGGEANGRDVWIDTTSPVGSFPPNAFGLYDMHGNVYQWVADCYQPNALLLPTDGSVVKDGNCTVRVMRSTSFTSNPHTLRSANRAGQYPPTLRGRNYLGFRVAKSLH